MTRPTTDSVLLAQRLVAASSPSAWIDAVVMRTASGGAVLSSLAGEILTVETRAAAGVGEPVAFHPVAEVLSVAGGLVRARRSVPGR